MSLREFHATNKRAGNFSASFIMWLGDSITYGTASSNNATKSYAALVSAYYGATNDNRGVGGSVVDPAWGSFVENGGSLIGYQQYYPATGNYGAGKYVFIAFGTNDLTGHDATDLFTISGTNYTWKQRLKPLVQNIIAMGYSPSQIILGTAPYQSVRTFMPSGITAISEIASELGTLYYNGYAYTQANGGDSLLSDGIHPNDTGHQVYANGLIAYLNSL